MLTTPRTTGPLISAATIPSSSHWGAFGARVEGGRMVEAVPHPADPDPSPLLGNVAGAVRHRSRVARPAVRRGWLERGPGDERSPERRGSDEFVEVDWDEALDLVAGELRRVREQPATRRSSAARTAGPAPAGSTTRRASCTASSTASAATRVSVNSYCTGASEVILPHVVGGAARSLAPGDDVDDDRSSTPSSSSRSAACPSRTRRSARAASPATAARPSLAAAAASAGSRFELFSPLRSDLPDGRARATGTRSCPGTDTAVMLGLAHVLHHRGPARPRVPRPLHASAPSGFVAVRPRRGRRRRRRTPSGPRRSPASRPTRSATWPAGWPPRRTLVTRQLVAAARAARRAAGVDGHRAGRAARPDRPARAAASATATGRWATSAVAPAGARLPDVAAGPQPGRDVHPGRADRRHAARTPAARSTTTASAYVYPTSGSSTGPAATRSTTTRTSTGCAAPGARPTRSSCTSRSGRATARHADIVLPATTTLERDDVGGGRNDGYVIAMHAAIEPFGEARDDYEIFAELAERLGVGDDVHRGPHAARVGRAPLRALRERVARGERSRCRRSTSSGRRARRELPGDDPSDHTLFDAFRADPDARPLAHAERPDRAVLGDRSPASATTTAPATRRGSSRRVARRATAAHSRCT